MEQEEAIRTALRVGRVESVDAGGGRVAEVAQDRKMDVRIEVAERLDLDVRQQRLDALDAVEDGRHDDHRPCRLGDAIELETRQAPRRDEPGNRALENLD